MNKDVVDGINSVNTADNSTITEIYTLGGARVNSLQKGINIVRLANGKTVKGTAQTGERSKNELRYSANEKRIKRSSFFFLNQLRIFRLRCIDNGFNFGCS